MSGKQPSPTSAWLEVTITDFIARHVWHLARKVVTTPLTPRCRTCCLSDAGSRLLEDGRCTLCHEHQTPALTPVPNPHDLRLQKDDAQYDALVLISGGKDSTYLLHRLRTEHPTLRLLPVLVDTCFMSPVALRNAKRVATFFDLPLTTIGVDPSFAKMAFRLAFLQPNSKGAYTKVDMMDAHLIFDHALSLAASMGIPNVICGLSDVQVQTLFGDFRTEIPVPATLPQTYCGIRLQEAFTEPELCHFFDASRSASVPRLVVPFTIWQPNEEEIIQTVQDLGIFDAHNVRPMVTNNALIPLIGLVEMAKHGVCCWEYEFAEMIRQGKSDRRYWTSLFEMLEYASKTGRLVSRTAHRTRQALGLTQEEVGLTQPQRRTNKAA